MKRLIEDLHEAEKKIERECICQKSNACIKKFLTTKGRRICPPCTAYLNAGRFYSADSYGSGIIDGIKAGQDE